MSASDLALVAALVFAWGALSARLERFDVTAPITFVIAGLVLTHGPLAVLGVAPSNEVVKILAAAAAHESGTGPGGAVAELALGLAVGGAVGGAGGWLVKVTRRRGWVAEGFAGAAVLGLAVCAYASAIALHGNGFIAAFAGGLAFGSMSGRRGEPLRRSRSVRVGCVRRWPACPHPWRGMLAGAGCL